jgi:16S rRNA (cytidine1402-2'-O)-methyltransferase
VIARELTKKFEEVARLPLAQAPAWLEAHAHRQQGEFVLVLGPGPRREGDLREAARVLEVLLESLPASEAARLAARITGASRNALYELALQRRK